MSSFEALRSRLNANLLKVWKFGANFGSSHKIDSLEDEGADERAGWDGSGSRVKAKILGFEILERDKKLTVNFVSFFTNLFF